MTVQRKTLAKGTIIEIGEKGGTLAEYGRIETFTPPTQDYEAVEVPELNPQTDAGTPIDADPTELGDEIFGEFQFTHYWDPMHADADALDDWWAAKEELTFRLTTPHPTTPAAISFDGKIKTLAPAQLAKKDYFKRTVTVLRTSAVTKAAPT
jgi:hypothetical protein